MTRLLLAARVLMLLSVVSTSALALPDFDDPASHLDDPGAVVGCPDFLTPMVELVRTTSVIGYPIVGFTVRISAENVKFHGKPIPACGHPDYLAPVPHFSWDLLSSPEGSAATLREEETLAPLLSLDKRGTYVAELTVCPGGCTVTPPDPRFEPIDVEEQRIEVTIEALEFAPLGPETMPLVPQSSSVGLTEPPTNCGLLAGALGKQWWAVRQIEGPDDFRLVEGFVARSRVSRKDSPLNHGSQDVNFHIEPDPKYSNLRFTDQLPVPDPIEVEWERDSIPERYRPTVGDRASVFGYWVTDCGHSQPEIHPPVGIAVHRPRPIRIPDTETFDRLGGETVGTGVHVPGIITDMFFSTDGGALTGCGNDTGLANAEPIQSPGGNIGPDCVPAPSIRRVFEFDIHLPADPRETMQRAGYDPPRVPLYVQRDPVTPGPEPAIDIRTTGAGVTYLHVTLDLSNHGGQTYAYRIAAGWVLPSADNWGLARYRLRLHRLNVTDDGDGALRGDGDWRMWVNTNNATNEGFPTQEWVQIIDHDVHGLEEFGGRPWETGAPTADRSLGPDLLRYPPTTDARILGPRDYGILFHGTGYERDDLTDDDVGTVLLSHVVPGMPFVLPNYCAVSTQAAGLIYSGCVRYTAFIEAVSGPALPPPVLSQAAQDLAAQYVLRCRPSPTGNDDVGVCGGLLDHILAPPQEALAIGPLDTPLPPGSDPRQFTEYLLFRRGGRETTQLTEVSIADFHDDVVRTRATDPELVRRVLGDLRAVFDARLADTAAAAEAILDAQIVKAAVPADLWSEHFGDLPAPRPEPGASEAKFTGAASLDSASGRVRLRSLVLHCAMLRTPNSLSVVWGRGRFDLDLVLHAACTTEPGAKGGVHTLRGSGIGRLNGAPGALIEWTLVDRGEPGVNDTASITIRSADEVSIALAASGRVTQGNLQATKTWSRDGGPDRMPGRSIPASTVSAGKRGSR